MDSIRREDAVQAVKAYLDLCCLTEAKFHKGFEDYNDEIARDILDQITPSIDIVRCKECKHWTKGDDTYGICYRCTNTRQMRYDDWCSQADRKE